MSTIQEINTEIDVTIGPNGQRKVNGLVLNGLLKKVTNFLQGKVNEILQYNNFKPIHIWTGTKLKLQNPDGTYSPEVDLRGPLPNLGLVGGKNLFNPNSANLQLNKAVDTGGNGQVYDFPNYVSSEYYAVTPGEKYTFSGLATNKGLRFEDAARALVSGAALSGAVATTITVPANAAWMMFTVRNNSEAAFPPNLQVEKSAVATAYQAYTTVVTAIEGSPIKASAVVDGATLAVAGNGPTALQNKAAVEATVAAGLPTYGIRLNPNLFDRNSPNLQQNKAIDFGGNGTLFAGFAGYVVSDYMPVLPGEKYTFSGVGVQKAVQFSDAAKVKISGAALNANSATTITIPANTAFLLYTVKASSEGTIPLSYQLEKGSAATPYTAFGTGQIHAINGNPLAPYFYKETTGLKLMIVGDSIATMWPQYIQYPYWSVVSNVATSSAWIKDKAGAVVASESMSVQIQNAIDQALLPDVIGIFMGTNDSPSASIGTYEAAMAKTTLESLDRAGSLYEALRYNYWKITTQWPNAKVFHATPLQRADRTIDQMKPINDAIKRMAATYCVRIIDAEAESPIIRQYEVAAAAGRHLYDGVHPNDNARKLLADYYMKRVIRALV